MECQGLAAFRASCIGTGRGHITRLYGEITQTYIKEEKGNASIPLGRGVGHVCPTPIEGQQNGIDQTLKADLATW